jgi:hypothetical protein
LARNATESVAICTGHWTSSQSHCHSAEIPLQEENQSIECPLSSLVNITTFDRQFGASYRESSFLLNRQVPDSVRKSVASGFDVGNIKKVVSSSELINRFGGVKKSILSMGPLYDVRISLGSPKDDKSFNATLVKGFQYVDCHTPVHE